MSECNCKLSKKDELMQSLTPFVFIFQFLGLLYYTIVASKRSKRKNIVLPKAITFRIYQSGISGGQFLSISLWAYGIPTFLSYALKGVEEIGGQCEEYIEIKIYVPETRHQQADLLMRQWINHSYQGIVILTPPVDRNMLYSMNMPMVPHGIPYKPIMLSEKFMIFLFQSQLNSLPNSHKVVVRNKTTKTKQRKGTTTTPKTKQIKKINTKRYTKQNKTIPKKTRNNSAKLFD